MNNCYGSSKQNYCPQHNNDELEGFALAIGYVPWQNLHTLYEPDKALQVGTIFPELNKPFEGRRIK